MTTITVSDNTGSTVGGITDTELNQFNPTTNSSTDTQAYVDAWVAPDNIVTMFLKIPIPSGSGTVSDAEFEPFLKDRNYNKSDLSLFEILRTDALPSQATYVDYKNKYGMDNRRRTQGSGTDRSASAIASVDIGSTAPGVYVTFTGAGLDALIQDAVTNAKPFIYVNVQFTDLTPTIASYVRFATSEGADGERPILRYTLTAGGGTVVDSDGSSAGAATTSGVGVGINTTVCASVGVSATSGIAAAVIPGVGSANGVGAVSGDTDTIMASVGASSGVSAVAGVGSSINGSVGASDGIATASSVSAAIAQTEGASTGTGTVNGEGEIVSPGSDGVAAGVATVTGVASYFALTTGTSTCVSGVAGVGEDAAAPEPEPLPYTRNSGTIEENFVVDYGDQQLDPYKYKQIKLPKRAKKAQKTIKESPIRSIIVEASGLSKSITKVIGRSAYTNTVFKTYKGQLVRSKPKAKPQLDLSYQGLIDRLSKLHNVDIYITPKG